MISTVFPRDSSIFFNCEVVYVTLTFNCLDAYTLHLLEILPLWNFAEWC